MSDKDALDCWVNTCPPSSIFWKKDNPPSSTKVWYKGACSECGFIYGIGETIAGSISVSQETYLKIKELNKE